MPPPLTQISPPTYWQAFEDLCLYLFREIWEDPLAKKNGREGFRQYGVDVYGSPAGSPGMLHGIQCKGKSGLYGARATIGELNDELAKAEKFEPHLGLWIFATTAPKDPELEKSVRLIRRQRESVGAFPIEMLAWEDIVNLMVRYPTALREFYPNHVYDMPTLITAVEKLPSAQQINSLLESLNISPRATHPTGNWDRIIFDNSRGLAPALSGLELGPLDAEACPQIPEVKFAIEKLSTGYSVRIYGVSGAGKSLCAIQAAKHFADNGYTAFRLSDSKQSPYDLMLPKGAHCAVYIIDDAHLIPNALLNRLESQTSSSQLVVSTFSTPDLSETPRGAVRIDHKRAVRSIAASLRSERPKTLAAVSKVDNWVGDRSTDESIDHRLDEAESTADFPWQFTFILGGGWRRARHNAESARIAKAHIVLSAAAMRQLASRDAHLNFETLARLCGTIDENFEDVKSAVGWLVTERLLISSEDLRCPHQRFATRILAELISSSDGADRERIFDLINIVVSDAATPLSGVRVLLNELFFYDGIRGRRLRVLKRETISTILQRVWTAKTEDDLLSASMILRDLDGFVENWADEIVAPRLPTLAEWCAEAKASSGYGLGHLVNHFNNKYSNLCVQLSAILNSTAIANNLTRVTPETAFSFAELIRSLSYCGDPWKQRFLADINRCEILAIAKNWPKDEKLYSLAKLCYVLQYYDRHFGLVIVEAALPQISDAFARNPLAATQEFHDLFWHVLRALDPLGVYVGRFKQIVEEKRLSVEICRPLSARAVIKDLTQMTARDYQDATFLLEFIHSSAPAKFRSIVKDFNWEALNTQLSSKISNLDHNEIHYLLTLGRHSRGREKVGKFLAKHSNDIEVFSSKFALLYPEVGFSIVENGGYIDLSNDMAFSWVIVAGVVQLYGEHKPTLMSKLLSPHRTKLIASLERDQANTFEDIDKVIDALSMYAPEFLDSVLTGLDSKKCEKAWQSCLSDGKKAKKAAAALVDASLETHSKISEIAHGLRRRYPVASVRG